MSFSLPIDGRRFLFITGKGGVGKTTVAAALGRRLSEEGRRVLIAVAAESDSLAHYLGVPQIGEDVSELSQNLWAVRLTPGQAMREYGGMILKTGSLFDAVFENRLVRGFLDAVPGLTQWAVLGKAWFLATHPPGSPYPTFDCVLLDAPATGHGLDMLRVPQVILDVALPGVLRRDAEAALAMFKNEAECGVVVVTLPEHLPAIETLELCAAVRDELRFPLSGLVVNGVLRELFDDAEREELLGPVVLRKDDPADQAILAAVHRAARERVQTRSRERLRELGVPTLELPLLLEGAGTPGGIRELAQRF